MIFSPWFLLGLVLVVLGATIIHVGLGLIAAGLIFMGLACLLQFGDLYLDDEQ